MNALDNSRIGIAAQALGIAQGAYEAALTYAHERETFGTPIARHQLITGYLADMATRIEAARLLVYNASWVKTQHYHHDGPRHTTEASMAKLFAGDTAMWVTERAIQVLGGTDTRRNSLSNASSAMRRSPRSTREHKRSSDSSSLGISYADLVHDPIDGRSCQPVLPFGE